MFTFNESSEVVTSVHSNDKYSRKLLLSYHVILKDLMNNFLTNRANAGFMAVSVRNVITVDMFSSCKLDYLLTEIRFFDIYDESTFKDIYTK